MAAGPLAAPSAPALQRSRGNGGGDTGGLLAWRQQRSATEMKCDIVMIARTRRPDPTPTNGEPLGQEIRVSSASRNPTRLSLHSLSHVVPVREVTAGPC